VDFPLRLVKGFDSDSGEADLDADARGHERGVALEGLKNAAADRPAPDHSQVDLVHKRRKLAVPSAARQWIFRRNSRWSTVT
jgi:hypothetical protein